MRENIDIVVREDGSRVVRKNIDGIGDSAKDTASDLDLLKRALAAVGAAFAVDKLQEWSDAWGSASGLIRTSTKDLQEAMAVQDRLFGVAQKTRTEYNAVVELYSRSARAANDLGASQQDLINFTEGVGKALAVQHTSATQAAGALFQLGQALTGAKIQAQEYNSLIDNAPVILQTVAQHLDGTGGSIGGLTKLVKAGKVSNKEFFDAFLAGSADLDAKFAQTSNLFSQGWTVIKNAVIKYVGEMNEATGISDRFQKFAQWVGDNMPQIASAIVGFGAALAVALAPAAISQAIGLLKILFTLVAANPFLTLAAAVAGVITYLYQMRDVIKLGIDDTTTLGDLMAAMWEDIGPLISNVADIAEEVFSFIVDVAKKAWSLLTGLTDDGVERQESSWIAFARVVAKVFDGIGATVRAVMLAIGRTIGAVIGGAVENFKQLGNVAIAALKGDFKGVQDAIVNVFSNSKEVIAAVGDAWGSSFRDSFEAQAQNGLEATLDRWLKRAQEIGKSHVKEASGGVDLGQRPTPNPSPTGEDKDAAKALKRLEQELRRLKDTANPVEAAIRDMADAEDVFNRAIKAGLISQADAAEYMKQLAFQYEEALDPLKYMNDELKRHADQLKMSNEQAQIEADLYDRVNYLRRQGVKMGEEEIAQLRAKLVAEQALERIARARDELQGQGSGQTLRDFGDKADALKQLLGNPDSGFGAGNTFSALSDMLPWANLDGTKEQMQSFVQAHADMYAQIKALEDRSLVDHRTAEMLKAQADVQYQEMRLKGTQNFLGTLATLSSSSNKRLASIGKAAAVSQAIIDGYLAIQKALASPPGWPYNAGSVIAVTAAQAANVAAISSQSLPGFRRGGEYTVGGAGGIDSQRVEFMATPGEKIRINTPEQDRALRERDTATQHNTTNITINVPPTTTNRTASQVAQEVNAVQERSTVRNS